MLKINKLNNLIFPLFSSKNETYICPVLGSKNDFDTCYQLANGWRYFKYLNVIQNICGKYFQSIISVDDFLIQSKKHSDICKKKSEILIEKITNQRKSITNLNFSKCNIMGIINITPDSFFSSSRIESIDQFNNKINDLNKYNIDIVDIGAESTRPSSMAISVEEEYSRINEYLNYLDKLNLNVKISLDSRNYETIKKCLNSNISIINDISGLSDDRIIKLVKNKNISVVVMHMQNKPENMQLNPSYNFAPIDIFNFFKERIKYLLKSGIKLSQIIVDPGFGFGKSLEHNLHLIKYLPLFHSLGVPVLVGLSRKVLIENISKNKFVYDKDDSLIFSPQHRLGGSISLELNAYNNGAQIIRSHDTFETMQSIYCSEAVDINIS